MNSERFPLEHRVAVEERLDPAAVILAYVREHGRITRREVVQSCGLTEKQAEYRLRRLVQDGRLQLVGRGRGAHYVLTETLKKTLQNSEFGV